MGIAALHPPQESSSGLYFYNARYYDATIGRFISADSIVPDYADPQSFNRYSYCYNNPTTYIDEDGHFAFIPFLVAIGVGALIGGGTEAAIQIGDNLIHGRGAFDNFSWTDVGIGTGIGGATGPIPVPWGGKLSTWAAKGTGKIFSYAKQPVGRVVSGITSKATPTLRRLATSEGGFARVGGRGPHLVGRAGEIAAGIERNTKRIRSILNPRTYRVPDVLNKGIGIIGEVKNVAKLSYTKQLQDYVAIAQAKGWRFELTVRQSTKLSRRLQELIDSGVIKRGDDLPW